MPEPQQNGQTLTEQFLGAIAFAGDLTMGQPPEHSPVTAILAARIAKMAGESQEVCARTAQLGMIRWAGCTANAEGFAELFGDDIQGRSEMLAGRNPFVAAEPPTAPFNRLVAPLVFSHCEVAAVIARRAHFDEALVTAIGDLFEYWDGSGWPRGLTGAQIDPSTQYVWLASDLEVFTRQYDHAQASTMTVNRGGQVYARDLAAAAADQAPGWLTEIAGQDLLAQAFDICRAGGSQNDLGLSDALSLLADFSDLKRPEVTGLSRAASRFGAALSRELGLSAELAVKVEQSAMLCGLGYVSVTNAAFKRGNFKDRESLRLVPYWTERILSRAPAMTGLARTASMAFERLDGSGWHRGLQASGLPLEARVVQVALLVAEIRAKNKVELDQVDLVALLTRERDAGRLDPSVVNTALHVLGAEIEPDRSVGALGYDVTEREREVLALLMRGLTNKEMARRLEISPKTVGAHLENLYRKLGVTTRAAAAIKALGSGLVFE